jgi:hypothetical protein
VIAFKASPQCGERFGEGFYLYIKNFSNILLGMLFSFFLGISTKIEINNK